MEGRFDEFSYRCGVIDSFCEMVAAGNKPLALSHPFRDGADRARYLPHCRAMAEQYGVLFREEDALPVTPLFPRAAVDGVKVVLFAEDGEVWRRYQAVKDLADPEEAAWAFGRLLGYSAAAIRRKIEANRGEFPSIL